MQERIGDIASLGAELVAVGFSPPEALAPLADHLAWPHRFLSDPERILYARLGIGRGATRRVWSRGTVRIYARALRHGHRVHAPVEDSLQLGGDVVVRGGRALRVFRPRSPDDRPSVDRLVAALRAEASG